MQLRVLLLTNDAKLRSRVQRMLGDVDAFVRAPKGKHVTWEATEELLSDVLLAHRCVIPEPVDRHIQQLAEALNAPEIVVLSESNDAREVTALRSAGAEACLQTDVSDRILASAISLVVKKRRDHLTRLVAVRRIVPKPRLADFVSTSPAMLAMIDVVRRVTDSDPPLLISGETGVGKERLARAIHNDGFRGDGPFISVNCGAIPENLLESHLFGHERGAFTGATRTQRGCFELAHGGTLFLDEICEMPFHLQVKLLHILQDYGVTPVGSERKIPVNVRVIAATNRDIRKQVEQKQFREDLYYRLAVLPIEVPPLRQRQSDLPVLAASILDDLSARIRRGVVRIAPEAMTALCTNYTWPGNIRELINVIERAMLLCTGDEITLKDLPAEIATGEEGSGRVAFSYGAESIPEAWLSQPLKALRQATVERFEEAYLTKLLTITKGRVGEAAKRADMETRTLFNKMKRYGLRKEDFRASEAR